MYPKMMLEKKLNPHRERLNECPPFPTMQIIEARYMNTTIWIEIAIVSITIYLDFSLSSFNNLLNIIVLLILAGVTIGTLFGDNGIIGRASQAKNEWEKASQNEMDVLNQIESDIGKFANGTGGSKKKIEAGKIVEAPGGTTWDEDKVNPTLDESGEIIPVPEGFYYVGGSRNTGVVISDDVDDEGKQIGMTDSGEIHDLAQMLKGNQFVWVPVEDIDEMADLENQRGKLYDFKTSTPIVYSPSGFREPDVVTIYDTNTNVAGLGIGVTTTAEFKTYLQNDFNNMVASVEKYGGFYIGRYETGDLSKSNVVVKAGNEDIGGTDITWYVMYKGTKEMYKENTSVESSMIWGSQWDVTLRWMNQDEGIGDYVKNSTGKGNYKDAEVQYYDNTGNVATKASGTSLRIPTGSAIISKVHNIYDMAGNVREWTLETAYNTCRQSRRRSVRHHPAVFGRRLTERSSIRP